MRIEIKGRNVPIEDELRERVEKKFAKVARQVPPDTRMEVELMEEANPAIHDREVVEITLPLMGAVLRAREASDSMIHSVNLAAEDIARQVKRRREKRRGERSTVRMPSDLSAPSPNTL
ncbi:MAG: ribosome-associated translation inhibitor RaiA [Thermoleophilaceae bacterium]|nr:ribosome-associated translation inhibitor RaiA [Thermoleophilaceae bacterium]